MVEQWRKRLFQESIKVWLGRKKGWLWLLTGGGKSEALLSYPFPRPMADLVSGNLLFGFNSSGSKTKPLTSYLQLFDIGIQCS